jgi:hypothetical protein
LPAPFEGVTVKVVPLHIVGARFRIDGVGLTVTGTVVAVEVHPLAVAVIVKVVLWAVLTELLNVPAIGEPLPLSPMPLRLALEVLVHEYVVPGTLFGFVRITEVIALPEQTVCVAGAALIVGIVFTTTVVEALPLQFVSRSV